MNTIVELRFTKLEDEKLTFEELPKGTHVRTKDTGANVLGVKTMFGVINLATGREIIETQESIDSLRVIYKLVLDYGF